MGKISKGVTCSIKDCNEQAVRSISREEFEKSRSGLALKEDVKGRVYLCKKHYNEYKKAYRKNVWSLERFSR
ncbi:hypothetical protein [Thermofilum sp.]|jgi:hypothetical protein|uniref:hypothetical protein n=1 Tax=Thermofilum sp. TaxID=1961369 RepID=UPI00259101F7|nr:hypothetical protein [Thermofilum sp.]